MTTEAATSTKAKEGIVIRLRMWAEKKDTGWIRIRMAGSGRALATVTNDPSSERYNRILFRNLRLRLIQEGHWPFGEEGGDDNGSSHQIQSSKTVDVAPITNPSTVRYQPIRARGGASASEILIRDRGRF